MVRPLFVAATTLMLALPVHGASAAPADQVARGEYLAHAADCVACHTAPGGTPYAGGRAFTLPFGVLYSPNITPDQQTGIGAYSDEDWLRLMHKGIAHDGKHLYPAMPYTSYSAMSDEDALAIKAYLISLAPVAGKVPENKIGFPFNQRWGLVFWNLFNNPNRRFVADPAKSEAYNRGAYLVNALGHCGECHTPRNFMMGLKTSKAFAGEVQADWRAYNITSDAKAGIGGWSDEQLAQYLSTGQTAGRGPASGPMAEAVEHSLGHLKPEDIQAMVTYLRGVPAQGGDTAADRPAPAVLATDALGQRLFVQACAGCHLTDGGGRQSPWAALGGSHTTRDPAATNLVQVLAQGSEIRTPQGLMFMHPFTGAYTDTELAAIAGYVQHRFGAIPATVTPADIGKARGKAPEPAGKPSS